VNNPDLIERSEVVREKGTNRKNFFKGHVDKYTWVDIGSSYLPGELIAAFLYGQLLEITRLQKDRLEAWARYDAEISKHTNEFNLSTPRIPESVIHNAHLYYILVEKPDMRSNIIADMNSQGITTPFHYIPLHDSPAGKKYTRTSGGLLVTNTVSKQLIRLPMYPAVKISQTRIIESLFKSLKEYCG
jgi:dTDP-4-amino-4,6-dideoxygalactose transaminase